MDKGIELELKKTEYLEDEFNFLYKYSNTMELNQHLFDEFGNYTYPTNFTADTPNTAIGTALGFSLNI